MDWKQRIQDASSGVANRREAVILELRAARKCFDTTSDLEAGIGGRSALTRLVNEGRTLGIPEEELRSTVGYVPDGYDRDMIFGA